MSQPLVYTPGALKVDLSDCQIFVAIQCNGDGLSSKLWRGVIWDFRFVLCNTWTAPGSFKLSECFPPHPLNDKYKDPSLDILHLLFCSSLSQSPNQYRDHPQYKKAGVHFVCLAARFLYWTLGRCRSARSMHAPEKSDIHRQVYNPYLYPCYHFVHQKYFLLTQTPIFEVSQLRPRCFAICSAI